MNEPIDTYRDAFLVFIKEGMTYTEALEQFDAEQWRAAVRSELETVEARHFNHETLCYETHDGKPSLLDLQVKASLEQALEPCEQCFDLWSAGWTSEVPNPQYGPCQSISLYWRRPPIGKRKQGRLFLSTNQAWMALKKQ